MFRLHLVRAAVDRRLAHVEVGRRERRDERAAGLVGLPACGHRLAVERYRGRAGSEHHQLRVALLDLAAADLQEAGDVERGLAALLGREHPQHHHLEGDDVDLEERDLVAEAPLVVDAFGGGDALQPLELALGAVDVGDVGALVREQVLGVSPALVLLADQLVGGNLDVVEPDLVDLALAVHRDDRPHRDARALHVDQEKADAGLRLAFVAGAHEAEDPVAVLAERGPGLLAVDDVLVAAPLGLGLERRQVRPRARLAVALAPPDLAAGDAGQEALLLLGRAERHDHRRDHHRPERDHARRSGERRLFLEQVLLDRVPARAAELLRPAPAVPALFAQDLGPALQLVARQMNRVADLVADLLRQIGAHPGADLLAEGLFFRREGEVHDVSGKRGRTAF